MYQNQHPIGNAGSAASHMAFWDIWKRLDGGFNPIEKYDRQNGNLPQIGVEIKKYLKPPG